MRSADEQLKLVVEQADPRPTSSILRASRYRVRDAPKPIASTRWLRGEKRDGLDLTGKTLDRTCRPPYGAPSSPQDATS